MMEISFAINGKPISLSIEPRELLVDVLRQQLRLTGAKRSCDVGVCGACTVLLDGIPATSCSMLAADVDGRSVTTIEGLSDGSSLHPIQAAFVEHGALQCGFCTPGMILATHALLSENPSPSEAEIRHHLSGNICRCTGYVKIIEAVIDASRNASPAGRP
ncbi:MAG: (2Fe-2S)-binding protein [Burkholderiaceae bacterium]